MNPSELKAGVQQAVEKLRALAQSDPQIEPLLEQVSRMQAGYQELLVERDALITEQKSLIEQLKRMLFGPKSEQLTPEQETQLTEVAGDLQEQVARRVTDSQEVLIDETASEQKEDQKSRRPRLRRPVPVELEVITTVLEPAEAACQYCGKLGDKIGEEVSEQVDLIPAKLIVRRTVRIKRGCRCGCGGVAIAPLPAALIPGSRLGLGLAVFILLSKYDDHLALYTLEKIFRERHGMIIPRQQMVQWAEQVAVWLQALYDAMWQGMLAGGYLQVDETSVRVLDPEVQGKAARGYLWLERRRQVRVGSPSPE